MVWSFFELNCYDALFTSAFVLPPISQTVCLPAAFESSCLSAGSLVLLLEPRIPSRQGYFHRRALAFAWRVYYLDRCFGLWWIRVDPLEAWQFLQHLEYTTSLETSCSLSQYRTRRFLDGVFERNLIGIPIGRTKLMIRFICVGDE